MDSKAAEIGVWLIVIVILITIGIIFYFRFKKSKFNSEPKLTEEELRLMEEAKSLEDRL